MGMWGWALLVASISFVIFVLVVGYILVSDLRDSVVFRPSRTSILRPDEPHRDEMIGETMTRWYQWGHPDTLFFLHGNSGTMDDRDYMVEFCKLSRLNLVMMDYRGYGQSKGIPSITNMREDASAVLDSILESVPAQNVIIMSESLGSIAASYLAANYRVKGVLILAGISSFSTLAKNIPKSGLMKGLATFSLSSLDNVTNASLLSKSTSPILIVHSKEDMLVPFACAIENSDSCRSELLVVEGGHSTPIITREALQSVLAFMGVVTSVEEYDEWRSLMRTIGNTNRFRVINM
jgi:pimeloyl-ACP methyl ester carboxylesterase